MSEIRKALENENVSEDMIKKVLKELGIKESKRWEPEIGEEYWTVSRRHSVMFYKWEGNHIDRIESSMGNVFKTKEEAEHHHDKLNFLAEMKMDFEDNSDEIDWNSGSATKYHIHLRHTNNKLEVGHWNSVRQQGAMLTTNREWLEQYIIDNEEDIKKYCFGVE